ncbi:hypothetical protein V2S66_09830 [Streptomyces sp. V4-01]|uniref:STAS domain-containing protein n=1 Tax=Actinacidiphila polyblastidii TaxID=3110430 RepID=A0ABU7PB17_9ACTN|nr:hypothetical protein [Streptomyces sp. V4-01]
MDILAYRDRSMVVVEVPGIIDMDDQQPVFDALRAEVDRCAEPLIVVRMLDPLVTSAGLHVLDDAHRYARARGIALRVVVHPMAVRVFDVVGLDHLLREE